MSILKLINIALLSIYFLDVYDYLIPSQRFLRRMVDFLKWILIIFGILNTSLGSFDHILLSVLAGLIYLPLMVHLNPPRQKIRGKQEANFIEWFKTLFLIPKVYRAEFIDTLKEELIWRCALVYLLSSLGLTPWLIMVISGLLFFTVHFDLTTRIIIVAQAELLFLSMLLYLIYLLTGSVMCVLIVHFCRNSYLKFSELFNCYSL